MVLLWRRQPGQQRSNTACHGTSAFRYRHFTVQQEDCSQKVGTDSMLLGAWVAAMQPPLPPSPPSATQGPPLHALDIGTGTGVLALMLAQKVLQHTADAHIDAIDIDRPSCLLARRNADASPGWGGSIRVLSLSLQQLLQVLEPAQSSSLAAGSQAQENAGVHPDLSDALIPVGEGTGQGNHAPCPYSASASVEDPWYDVIISNPPYFSGSTKPPPPVHSSAGTGATSGGDSASTGAATAVQAAADTQPAAVEGGRHSRRAAARHADVALPFQELAAGVAKLLRPRAGSASSDGTTMRPPSAFYVVLPADGAAKFAEVATGHGLRMVRIGGGVAPNSPGGHCSVRLGPLSGLGSY